jgi:hypothetical protein
VARDGERYREELFVVLPTTVVSSHAGTGRNESSLLDECRSAKWFQESGSGGPKGGEGAMKIEQWHRRQAITLASQLPDNPADALMVLQAARELVETFLQPDTPEPAKATAKIVTLVRDCPDLSA